MAMLLNQNLTRNGRREARKGQRAARTTMTAAEWGKQLLPPSFPFIPLRKISMSSQPFVLKRERQQESGCPHVVIT
jgi:hypothetical protein